MVTYIIRRFVQGFIVLALSTFVIYTILVLTPGGPMDQVNEAMALDRDNPPNPVRIKALMAAYKLDSPYPVSYLRWLFDPTDTTRVNPDNNNVVVQKGINIQIGDFQLKGAGWLTGDFGNSLQVARGQNVMGLMWDKLGNTLALTSTSLLLSILIAFPIGIISAVRQYSRLDYSVTAFSFVGLSMPAFWLGLMLSILFGVLAKQLHDSGWTWLPYLPTGFAYDTDQQDNIINRIYHLILPVSVLSFVNVAGFSR
ncbi:MAG: ABC transporter permease, partial [Chloroflexia bacterium]